MRRSMLTPLTMPAKLNRLILDIPSLSISLFEEEKEEGEEETRGWMANIVEVWIYSRRPCYSHMYMCNFSS